MNSQSILLNEIRDFIQRFYRRLTNTLSAYEAACIILLIAITVTLFSKPILLLASYLLTILPLFLSHHDVIDR